jgi:hypothetical protein
LASFQPLCSDFTESVPRTLLRAIGAITDPPSVKDRVGGDRHSSAAGLRLVPDAWGAPLYEPEQDKEVPVTEIFLMIVPYLFICGLLGTAAYVMVEIFGDGHRHQH